VQDAARRIQVFETLITNQHLGPADSIPKPPSTPKVPGAPQLVAQLEDRKLNFWHALSKFTTIRVPEIPALASDSPPSNSAMQTALNEVENCLTEVRQVLDAFENRDILYSVAIVRHYLRPGADRVPPPSSNDEADRGAKLSIARNFLAHEKHSGTFQVAKVVAGMVVRSWRPQQEGS
jgi:white-opaque regulator 2